MSETSCDIIRDLLPLYEDGAVSEETAKLVREHIAGCPACWEELGKMRTPISLPPEENGPLWERYQQRRAEIRRKRNVKIVCVLSLLAALTAFCLWYTRPRTWTEITGEDVRIGLAHLTMPDLDWEADTAMEKLGYKHWKLDQDDPSLVEVNAAILQILERHTFRASLDSLVPRDSIHMGAGGDLTVFMKWGEENSRFFYFMDTGKAFTSKDWGWDIYQSDPALFDELAELVQTYGVPQED